MLVRNEKFELIDSSIYAQLISTEGIMNSKVTEDEAEKALMEMFQTQSPMDKSNKNKVFLLEQANFLNFKRVDIKKIWIEVKKFFCKLATTESTLDELIKIIIEAVASVVVLGALILKAIQIIVEYLIRLGVDKVCPV